MGLDMFLESRRFIWARSDNDGPDAEVARKIREAVPELGDMKLNYVTAEAAYWRKANAVHKWFVDNVQEGEDDCEYHYVSRKQLEELADICDKVIKNPSKAGSLLPTASGPFFGGTTYDEWYIRQLTYTRDRLRNLLARQELDQWEFYYHASW